MDAAVGRERPDDAGAAVPCPHTSPRSSARSPVSSSSNATATALASSPTSGWVAVDAAVEDADVDAGAGRVADRPLPRDPLGPLDGSAIEPTASAVRLHAGNRRCSLLARALERGPPPLRRERRGGFGVAVARSVARLTSTRCGAARRAGLGEDRGRGRIRPQCGGPGCGGARRARPRRPRRLRSRAARRRPLERDAEHAVAIAPGAACGRRLHRRRVRPHVLPRASTRRSRSVTACAAIPGPSGHSLERRATSVTREAAIAATAAAEPATRRRRGCFERRRAVLNREGREPARIGRHARPSRLEASAQVVDDDGARLDSGGAERGLEVGDYDGRKAASSSARRRAHRARGGPRGSSCAACTQPAGAGGRSRSSSARRSSSYVVIDHLSTTDVSRRFLPPSSSARSCPRQREIRLAIVPAGRPSASPIVR